MKMVLMSSEEAGDKYADGQVEIQCIFGELPIDFGNSEALSEGTDALSRCCELN